MQRKTFTTTRSRGRPIDRRPQLAPRTPLLELLLAIPAEFRKEFYGIALHPELGFYTNQSFNSFEMTLSYLGAYCSEHITIAMPYVKEIISMEPVTIGMLIQHCERHPRDERLQNLIDRLPENLRGHNNETA